MSRVIISRGRSRLLLATLVTAGLLPAAGRADDWTVTSDINRSSLRQFSADIPPGFHIATSCWVQAIAFAHCAHGDDFKLDEMFGTYIDVSRQGAGPVQVSITDLSAVANAKVDHAKADAINEIQADATINGNSVTVEVKVVNQTREYTKVCPDGTPIPYAFALTTADPVVFGAQQFVSWEGLTYDPLPPQSDGTNRYVEQQLSLPAGGAWTGGLAGSSPVTKPDGTRSINQVVVSQYVRAGSNDDPKNLTGTMIYQLSITRSPDGGLAVIWTPGTNTADFAFSFTQPQAQIEADVAAYFAGGNTADLPLGTIRVTMLQDETAMPNMTLLSYDVTEVWAWDTGNPTAFGGTEQWWQAPDMSTGGFRSSSMAGGQVYADDFVCTATAPAMVDGLRWWGTYGGESWTHRPNLPYVLPFMIQWYASDGAPHPTSRPLAGPPLMAHLVQANRFFVDYTLTGDAIYEFNARLTPAFMPPGPGEYFVSIADVADLAWQWMDATSTYLDTPAWTLGPVGPWMPDVFPDLSFVLLAAIPPDGDRDGDVDPNDVSLFAACVSGPTVPFGPGCATYDLDGDQDVDLADFGVLQRCYSGTDQPADPACLRG